MKLLFPIALGLLTMALTAFGAPGPETREGAIVRGATAHRRIALVFTGHEFGEGATTILDELEKHHGKASFFLTGDFLANPKFTEVTRRIIRDGHYLGPHSDKHPLYCPWDGANKTLVTRDQFRADLESNLKKIEALGVSRKEVRFFLPPFEHYNEEIARWTKEMRLTLINNTPGTRSNADYTGEQDSNFVSATKIFESIAARERNDPNGLKGFILLLHIGAGPTRQEKFESKFGELLDFLQGKGYELARVDQMLEEQR